MDADNAVAQATAAPPVDRHAASDAEFDVFFQDSYRGLMKAVMLFGATKPEADEAVSQAMIKVHARWHRIADPLAYARRTAINDFVRERTHLPRIRARQVERRDGTPEYRDDPRLTFWEDRQWVNQLLNRLAPAQREVMAAVVDGFQPGEIAKLVGRSPEAVRRSLADARERLRNVLRDEQVADSNGTPGREAR